ncbi:MAG: hypothetical protein Q4D26_09340 [Clostridia bacterium]|nr:hypothetical protein [Clostridia bacterium]
MRNLHLIMEELCNVVYDIDTFEYVLNSLELAYETNTGKDGNYIINSTKIQIKALKDKINNIAIELDKNM